MRCFLLLAIVLSGYCYAQNETYTDIVNVTNEPVQFQCNKWGWLSGLHEVYWKTSCTPLEVKTAQGKIYAIPTTVHKCNDPQVADYKFLGDSIFFEKCSKP